MTHRTLLINKLKSKKIKNKKKNAAATAHSAHKIQISKSSTVIFDKGFHPLPLQFQPYTTLPHTIYTDAPFSFSFISASSIFTPHFKAAGIR